MLNFKKLAFTVAPKIISKGNETVSFLILDSITKILEITLSILAMSMEISD